MHSNDDQKIIQYNSYKSWQNLVKVQITIKVWVCSQGKHRGQHSLPRSQQTCSACLSYMEIHG